MTRGRGVWAVAAVQVIVLVALGSRYGFHRDELYFVEAGRHPAWGYPDQPPLTPLLATAWYSVTGGHLWLFRIVPAVAAGLTVLVAAATSARLGGDARARTATAVVTALTAFGVAMGHLFSTATFTYLLSALAVLLLLRALRGDLRDWLLLGVVTGIAMEVQTLPALLMACCLVALLAIGPDRSFLRTPGPWLAAVIALALAAPYLLWQSAHGWPQLQVAAGIASGGSTSSTSRWMLVPSQLLICGPLGAVVLVTGVVVLLRRTTFRWLAVAYLLLLALTLVLGGKAYYPDGLVPAMLAAGAPALLAGSRVVGGLLVAAQVIGVGVISLPIAPVGSTGYHVALAANPDVAETVGWDRLVAAVGRSPGAVILAANYGEAGALDRARRSGTPLPPVYSGHNGYGEWGPPPGSPAPVTVVGDVGDAHLAAWFTGCRLVSRVRTGGDGQEDGAPVRSCAATRRSWAELWPRVRHLG